MLDVPRGGFGLLQLADIGMHARDATNVPVAVGFGNGAHACPAVAAVGAPETEAVLDGVAGAAITQQVGEHVADAGNVVLVDARKVFCA